MNFTEEKAHELVKFWLEEMNEKWFKTDSKVDVMVVEQWAGFLSNFQPIESNDARTLLGQILLCDQVSRHDKRVNNSDYAERYQQMCIDLTDQILKLYHSELNSLEYCFALLPYRHSRQPNLLEKSLILIREQIAKHPDDKYYSRFELAQLQAMAKYMIPVHYPPTTKYQFPKSIAEVLDPKTNFDPDKVIDIKLIEYSIAKIWTNGFRTNIKKEHSVCISLSGGVDSMICSYILKKMGYNVYAVMINYGNRKESDMEVELVKWWCQHIDIHLFVRHITELKRNRHSNDRSNYEEITRQIRFNTYINAHRIYCQIFELDEDEPVVVLGHNWNDGVENAITNLEKHRSFDNLTSMVSSHCENGVTIVRPILDKTKQQIFEFATERNIPCTFDSTPSWSERGKIRDKLFPMLNEYNPSIITGLIDFAKNAEQVSANYIKMIEKQTDININADRVVSINFPEETNDTSFWSYIFLTISRRYNMHMVGHKAITTLVEALGRNKHWNGIQHQLTKNMVIKLVSQKEAIVYYDNK